MDPRKPLVLDGTHENRGIALIFPQFFEAGCRHNYCRVRQHPAELLNLARPAQFHRFVSASGLHGALSIDRGLTATADRIPASGLSGTLSYAHG
jgi:hypothetical protein